MPMHEMKMRPDVVEMIVLEHLEFTTSEAWSWLEANAGVVKDSNVRPAWKDPTPTGTRFIGFGTTKESGEIYDGEIFVGGKRIAVFRFGRVGDEVL